MVTEFRKLSLDSQKDKSIMFFLGDCLVGMAAYLQEKLVDVVVTSPPYSIGIKYLVCNNNLGKTKYLEWMESFGIVIKKVLKDGGSFFLNIGNKPSDQWIAMDVANILRKHFILQNTILWIKSIAIEKVGDCPNLVRSIAPGHFNPVNSSKYLSDCIEYTFHFTKEGNVKLDKLADGLAFFIFICTRRNLAF